MAKKSRPRYSSLQYWPRKRARKALPRVNWPAIPSDKSGLLGFISYKVSMDSASLLDKTSDSMTKNKKIIVPVSILECPNMKIFSVRFYKNNSLVGEIIVDNNKLLKKLIKVPKTLANFQEAHDYDDVRILAYSKAEDTDIKNTPDLTEIGLAGTKEQKLEFAKSHINKEIPIEEFISNISLVDIRGLTKGKGLCGPVKRFHIGLKGHKSEKGVRRPGSLAPWHPARVTFHTPMAGQFGMFTRVILNNKVLAHGKITEKNINKKSGFKHFGNIKTSYVIIKGSVQGPAKRQLLLTRCLRPNKAQSKLNYEFLELQ